MLIGYPPVHTVQSGKMKEGSKYYPLYLYLRQSEPNEVTLAVADIQGILGATLPPSAWTQPSWWSNRSKGQVQAAAWMDAEFRVVRFDPITSQVTFRRKSTIYHIPPEWKHGDTLLWNGELIKALREQLGLSQVDLAEKLGVRHATISEWENDLYTPKRSTSKFLTLFAKESGFNYDIE
jgi:DNA-binding XRE family transcriptional regulator